MHHHWILIVPVFLFATGCIIYEEERTVVTDGDPQIREMEAKKMLKLGSQAFTAGQEIPKQYTCQGANVNPELHWQGLPKGTKSLALIMDDPDAKPNTWVHWLVKDIPTTISSIKENSIPGTEVQNSFGKRGYGGPCPPQGRHRYYFKLYALDVEKLAAETAEEFYKQAEEHKLEVSVFMGTYQKS